MMISPDHKAIEFSVRSRRIHSLSNLLQEKVFMNRCGKDATLQSVDNVSTKAQCP
ncbi:hypothetical protein [Fervidicoccus sp.]|uniref:hypothetical protein n=1 Tax=Fervidicoccus sp. TaxID=2060324 RepID=UPI003D146235